MTYVVLARKYRPQSFDDFVGQEAIAQTLRNAVDSDRVAHAYLFSGDRGLGKTSMVRVFAKALNCEKGPTGNPCNKCASCLAIHRGDDMDVVEIDGASHRTVDEISEVLQNVKYRPSRSRFKIYIIDEVHMLSTHAFNALLKTLEEPPPHVKFFFATTEANKVLDTIKSRCQRFDFRRIPAPAIAERLGQICKAEKMKADEPALMAIARSAKGSMRDSLSLLDQLMSFCGKGITAADVQHILGLVTDEKIAGLVDAIAGGDRGQVLKEFDALMGKGADVLDLLDQLTDYFRDLMVVAACKGDIELVKNKVSDAETVLRQSKLFPAETLIYMIQVLSEARRRVREGLDARLVGEMMLVRLAGVGDLKPLSEILRKLDAMEAAAPRGNPAIAPPAGRVSAPSPRAYDSAQKKTTEPAVAEAVPPPAESEPAPEAAPKPPPAHAPGAAPLDLGGMKRQWGEVVNRLKSRKRSLGYFLSEGQVESVGDDCVMVGFAPKCGTHRKMLEDRENKDLLEQCIAEVYGQRFQVKFSTLAERSEAPVEGPPPRRANPHEVLEKEPMVKKAVEMFGGRIVRVEE